MIIIPLYYNQLQETALSCFYLAKTTLIGTLVDLLRHREKQEGCLSMSVRPIRTKEEFLNSIKKGFTLVDFNAPWCAPCRLLEPIINNLASAFEGKASICALNVDEVQEVAVDLGIHSIPTLILFKDGTEVKRIVGLQTEAVLFDALDNAISGD